MTWPPQEATTIDQQGTKWFTVTINRTSAPSFKWKISQRSWEAVGANKARQRIESDEDDEMSVSRKRGPRPRAPVLDYNEDSDAPLSVWRGSEDRESAEPTRRRRSAKNRDRRRDRAPSDSLLDQPPRKKPRHREPSPLLGMSDTENDVVVPPNEPRRKRSRHRAPSPRREIPDSDSDVVILDDDPFRPKIKEEGVITQKEPFAVKVCCPSHMVYPCISFSQELSLTNISDLFQPF